MYHNELIELQEGRDTHLGLVSFIIPPLSLLIEEEWITSRPPQGDREPGSTEMLLQIVAATHGGEDSRPV